jgi:guanyl-specific ribonuclease Sa
VQIEYFYGWKRNGFLRNIGTKNGGFIMKKILAIILLVSSIHAIKAESWSQMLQDAVSGQPAASSAPANGGSQSWLEMLTGKPATPAASAPQAQTGTSWLQMLAGQTADRPAATYSNQTLLSQLTTAIPSLIANIKLIAPKALEIATQYTQGGWFSALAAVGSMDSATRNAFVDVITKLRAASNTASSLMANADPATKTAVKGVLAQVIEAPEFKSLLDNAKNIPIIGSQLDGYLKSLTAEAVK